MPLQWDPSLPPSLFPSLPPSLLLLAGRGGGGGAALKPDSFLGGRAGFSSDASKESDGVKSSKRDIA